MNLLRRTCSIESDGVTKIWKLTDNVTAFANSWATSFACLRTKSTLEFSYN